MSPYEDRKYPESSDDEDSDNQIKLEDRPTVAKK